MSEADGPLSAPSTNAQAAATTAATGADTATVNANPPQRSTLWSNLSSAVSVTADFAVRKGAEVAAAAQPHVSAAGEFIATKAGEVHSAAQPHVAAAGEYVAAKTDELDKRAGQLVNDASTGISKRASMMVTATNDSISAARDHISTKSTEAATVTRDSAAATHGYLYAKAAEAASLPFVAGEYVAAATAEQIEATKAAKLMLDEGGQDQEDRLLAKNASAEGVALESSAMANIADAARSLRDASEKLRKAAALDSSAAEAPEFTRLADIYVERAKKMEAFLQTVDGNLEAPPLSNKDSIAIGMLHTKLGYRSLFEPRQLPSGVSETTQEPVSLGPQAQRQDNAAMPVFSGSQEAEVDPAPHESRPAAESMSSEVTM